MKLETPDKMTGDQYTAIAENQLMLLNTLLDEFRLMNGKIALLCKSQHQIEANLDLLAQGYKQHNEQLGVVGAMCAKRGVVLKKITDKLDIIQDGDNGSAEEIFDDIRLR